MAGPYIILSLALQTVETVAFEQKHKPWQTGRCFFKPLPWEAEEFRNNCVLGVFNVDMGYLSSRQKMVCGLLSSLEAPIIFPANKMQKR